MAAYPSYQAYPGPPAAFVSAPPVLVAVADAVPQRRLTVAFRLLLAVPHAFILSWLALAGSVVGFIGWWGALFTGRLPQFAVSYQSGFLRWMTRVVGYCCLLTDVYPPFTFDDDPRYPVRVAVPAPQKLNRAAVFFRFILYFPVGVLSNILAYGAYTLLALVAWLVTLVTGRLPASFHLAYAAVLRFQTRIQAYWWMLTPVYPGGLFGDKPGAVAWADAAPGFGAPGFGAPGFGASAPGNGAWGYGAPGYGSPSGYPDPGGYSGPAGYGGPSGYDAQAGYGNPAGYRAPYRYDTPGYGTPGYGDPAGYGTPGYGQPAGWDTPGAYAGQPASQPGSWLLTLTSGARNLVVAMIVLGAVLLVGYQVANQIFVNRSISSLTARIQLNSALDTLSEETTAYQHATADCQNQACISKQAAVAASDFNAFSEQLATISVPASASAAKDRVDADTAAIASDFTRLSGATTGAQYNAIHASSGLQQTLDAWEQDVNALQAQLNPY